MALSVCRVRTFLYSKIKVEFGHLLDTDISWLSDRYPLYLVFS